MKSGSLKPLEPSGPVQTWNTDCCTFNDVYTQSQNDNAGDYLLYFLLCISMTHEAHPTTCPHRRRGETGGTVPTHSQSSARSEWGVSITLRPLYPRGRRVIHCTGGCYGLQGWPERAQKISPSPPKKFDPRTVQPAAQSLYRLNYTGHLLLSTQHTHRKFKIDTKDYGDMVLYRTERL